MAISSSNTLSWNDIETLYTNLNTARQKFGFTTVTVPGNPGLAKPSSISDLDSVVNAMASNKYLTSTAVTGVTVPRAGSLIYPLEFTRIRTTIDNINNTCAFDAGFNSNNNGFGFNTTFNSDNNGFGFNSGHRSSNNGFGFDSSNNGFHACSNNSFRSSMFSGYNNSFRS